tara:strand:- start:204 stop:551 length:348 start_codon:yes stop_codon:yes gene_type:complete
LKYEKKKGSLKQLADLIKYSISTISKSLNHSEEIKSDTKFKIMEAVKELGYTDSKVSFPSNKTVVVMIPDIRNDFFAQDLIGLEDVATENNFKIIRGFSNGPYDQEVAYFICFKK